MVILEMGLWKEQEKWKLWRWVQGWGGKEIWLGWDQGLLYLWKHWWDGFPPGEKAYGKFSDGSGVEWKVLWEGKRLRYRKQEEGPFEVFGGMEEIWQLWGKRKPQWGHVFWAKNKSEYMTEDSGPWEKELKKQLNLFEERWPEWKNFIQHAQWETLQSLYGTWQFIVNFQKKEEKYSDVEFLKRQIQLLDDIYVLCRFLKRPIKDKLPATLKLQDWKKQISQMQERLESLGWDSGLSWEEQFNKGMQAHIREEIQNWEDAHKAALIVAERLWIQIQDLTQKSVHKSHEVLSQLRELHSKPLKKPTFWSDKIQPWPLELQTLFKDLEKIWETTHGESQAAVDSIKKSNNLSWGLKPGDSKIPLPVLWEAFQLWIQWKKESADLEIVEGFSQFYENYLELLQNKILQWYTDHPSQKIPILDEPSLILTEGLNLLRYRNPTQTLLQKQLENQAREKIYESYLNLWKEDSQDFFSSSVNPWELNEDFWTSVLTIQSLCKNLVLKEEFNQDVFCIWNLPQDPAQYPRLFQDLPTNGTHLYFLPSSPSQEILNQAKTHHLGLITPLLPLAEKKPPFPIVSSENLAQDHPAKSILTLLNSKRENQKNL